jgi:hypothetical protein
MQTELVFGVKLANIAVADCENFLHDIAIFDRNFTTDDPITSGGKTVGKFSCAEEDVEPSSLATTLMRRTRGAGKQEWEFLPSWGIWQIRGHQIRCLYAMRF